MNNRIYVVGREDEEKQRDRVIKLAKLWAGEVVTRPVLASKSFHLMKAVQKLEKLEAKNKKGSK